MYFRLYLRSTPGCQGKGVEGSPLSVRGEVSPGVGRRSLHCFFSFGIPFPWDLLQGEAISHSLLQDGGWAEREWLELELTEGKCE